jgi:CAAX prenyl protease-like protein
MEKGLLHLWPNYPRVGATVFDPFAEIANPTLRVIFFVFRWLGPTLVVPVMEELFWRDYLWRTLIAPNDFKLARVGEWDTKAFWLVPVFFASVHVQWATAFVWAVMIGLLLLRTRSLGACIVMHAVTNFLLGAYVLWTHDWYFW